MPHIVRHIVAAIILCVLASPALALTTTVAGTPAVTIEVPAGFVASNTTRGVEIKTPDDEVLVWFELYKPAEVDTLIAEHEAYWKKESVVLGDPDRTTDTTDGHKITATVFKAATWEGKPTVVRYLFIDWGFPSHELILMSCWASPEGFQAHSADITKIISSIETK